MPQPPVFFADRAELQQDVILLSGAEGRHAAAVRRLRPGERADVGDGAGLVAECVVTAHSSRELELAVRARREVPRPDPVITVVQAIPKGDRGELAVEEMTEVGVDRIMPWAAARCVPVWRAERGARALARWRATAREAAKQSRRAWIPEVTELVPATDVAAMVAKAACAIVLDPGAAQSLGHLRPPESGDLVVIVGPEGGITDEENAAFRAAGATPRSLGPTVLRTSTAGAVAAAVLLSRSGRWLGPQGPGGEVGCSPDGDPEPAEDEIVSGVMVWLPVDDDGFDEADWLADDDALAFTLADDDALVLGVADVCPEGEDTAACAGVELWLVQVWFGVDWIFFWFVPPDAGLVLGPGLGLGDTGGLGVALGLPLGLTVALGLLVLALAEAPALGFVVLPPLWLPLDDVTGAVAFWVGLLADPVDVSVSDGCADGDVQELGAV